VAYAAPPAVAPSIADVGRRVAHRGWGVQEITRWRGLVGSRVVVRRRLSSGPSADPSAEPSAGPGGARLTDVLGELLEVTDDGLLRVQTRTGPVEVPLDQVVAGKPVPPRPSRPAPPHLNPSITDLVGVMARHWRPSDGLWLGGWWLRSAGGFTGRANSLIPLGPPDGDPGAAEESARRWYAARALTALASIAGPAAGGVPDDHGPAGPAGELFRARGWRLLPDGSALVLVAPTAELRSGPGLPAGLVLDRADRPDAGWLETYRYRGQALPPQAIGLLLSAPEQAFWSVRDGARTVAVARGSLAGGWAGVTAMDVEPAYRRRGLARVLLAELARWAWQRGARSSFLQTAESNLIAQRLYLSAGFVPHHRYDYLRAPAISDR
jgi:N-acetylglutamate synthase